MKYEINKNKIIIDDFNSFNTTHILECGQVFRYEIKENGYQVYSGEHTAKVVNFNTRIEIECSDVPYFENYFDLQTDYNKIKKDLSKFEVLKNAVEYGYGIRILRQAKLEIIIGFIISANNNIKRIQGSLKKLCTSYGTLKKDDNLGEYYAFPTLAQLSKITESEFKELGVGYRAKSLVKAIHQLKSFDLQTIEKIKTEEAIKKLTELSGVGPKVADCILLFTYYNMEVFPVDTWIEKIYNNYFVEKERITNRVLIRKNLTDIFKELSGYAQQYLFYYERDSKVQKTQVKK